MEACVFLPNYNAYLLSFFIYFSFLKSFIFFPEWKAIFLGMFSYSLNDHSLNQDDKNFILEGKLRLNFKFLCSIAQGLRVKQKEKKIPFKIIHIFPWWKFFFLEIFSYRWMIICEPFWIPIFNDYKWILPLKSVIFFPN